jgi:hypothetical protein
MAFTGAYAGRGLFHPRLLLLLILQHHHHLRPWVRPTPLSLFPLSYIIQCKSLDDFVYVHTKKSFNFDFFGIFIKFLGANKKILLRSGKGIPKSSQWKIEATFLIGFWGGGGERGKEIFLFCNIFGEELGEHGFHQNFASFMKSKSLKKKKKGEKKKLLIRQLQMCLVLFKKYFT